MGPGLAAEAASLLWALALGAALGLLWHFNRALRRASRAAALRGLWDVLWCLAAAAALFVFAMGLTGGRQRAALLAASAAGWGLYSLTFSTQISALASAYVKLIVKCMGKMRKMMGALLFNIKKIKKFENCIFSKAAQGFKIMHIRRGGPRAGKIEGSASREAREGRYYYPSDSGRSGGIRTGGPGRRRRGKREKQPHE